MKKYVLFCCFLVLTLCTVAQKPVTIIVKDSTTGEPLANATLSVVKSKKGYTTNADGLVVLNLTEPVPISFTAVGYQPLQVRLDTTLTEYTILLQPAQNTLAEVIVSSSRTDSRIEDLPTKVEVLGLEEVEEETGIKPSHIASLLGDVAGIQAQQTSATTGNTELRVQGLPGMYTQLLRDGMPLFGNFAGGFSILQIPPLDLKQIEIIKGASSTLYGGGAIAGLINVISKKPKEGVFEKVALLNYSSLNEANANVYLSNRRYKWGYTFFSGANHQTATDVDGDNFSDVAAVKSFFVHPVLYFYPNKNNTLSVGYNGLFENRRGGDMQVLHNGKSGLHQFFIQNKSLRNTADLQWNNNISNTKKFTFNAIGSWFNRSITSNTFGMQAAQLSYYSEAAYVTKLSKHDIVLGGNFNGESFQKSAGDSTRLPEYHYNTLGLFVQDDWRLHPQLTLQSGLRTDFNSGHGTFVLPRLSLLYRIHPNITTRLGGGLGYKIPTVFNSEIDERDYPKILPPQNAKAERSYGGNLDVNFQHRAGDLHLTINQSFFITQINHPLVTTYSTNTISFSSADKGLLTKGFETYVQLDYEDLEVYLGYTLTDAQKKYDAAQLYLELSARNKFASVVGYEFSEHFRTGVEAAVTGRQYLDDGSRSPAFLFMAAMMRYDIKNIAFVLNCENLLDYRQTRKESIASGPVNNPVFKQLWAPIDGRVINFSVRLKW